jgi:hypothetical protein
MDAFRAGRAAHFHPREQEGADGHAMTVAALLPGHLTEREAELI